MNIKFTNWIGSIALLLIGNFAWAQSQTPLDIALRHIEENHKVWNLTESDIQDMVVADMYVSKKSGTTHIYFNQTHEGIQLKNGIINLSILKDGTVNHVGKRFTADLANKVNAAIANLTHDQALQTVLNNLNIQQRAPQAVMIKEGNKYTYEAGEISDFKVISELLYNNIKGEIKLVWNVTIDPKNTGDRWEYAIDANSGKVIGKTDLITRCKFDKQPFHNHDAHCNTHFESFKAPTVKETLTQMNTTVTGGTYRVFPIPLMAPNEGTRSLEVNPHKLNASPFGWHDTNGDDTPEYTITRGNNVHAFLDRIAGGGPDQPEPDGGMDLIFDFPYDPNLEPEENVDAATVNVFYAVNMIHDFAYQYGFDEAAGNFQRNNYGNGGAGNDEVLTRVQRGAVDNGNGGTDINNASFGTPGDGGSGVMNMFVWNQTAAVTGSLNVTAPGSVAGRYNTITAAFGPAVPATPIVGKIIEVNDAVFSPYATDACEEEIANADDINGSIALIDRGGCDFELKTTYAEAAGAIAVIICNFEDDAMGMAASPDLPTTNPEIPTISIGAIDCATIRQFAGNGLEAEVGAPAGNSGPTFIDGDFDNGIIEHEYGHGISNRLTAGPNNTGCLQGVDTDGDGQQDDGEQMGEGWSDFMSLVMSAKEGDTGEMRRGIGTYVQRIDPSGTGIRVYPYSTDMEVNPLTYDDINTVSYPHGVGTVWCSILWDLYWRMAEEYTFDADAFNGTGGNNQAIQLVMAGMQNQPCQPGFVDGREAILAADRDLYGGANQCLIWEVFARRGVGIDADQGSTMTRSDQTSDFNPLPTCIEELKISKTVTPLIDAGDDIDVAITVINHKKEDLQGIVVTDELPEGTSYVEGSASIAAADVSVSGNMITFVLGEMATLDERNFTYKLATSEDNFSIRNFYDDVEDPDENFWFPTLVLGGSAGLWTTSADNPNSGVISWFVRNVATESRQVLQAGEPNNQIMISGDNPVLRFYHSYNTQPGVDGGVIEISTDGGTIWNQLDNDMIRGGYNGFIQYTTFVIPNFNAFFGDSEGYIATYVDLSDYAGQEVVLRWNFGTDAATAPTEGGWYVDDIELMDMLSYNGEACVTSEQGDQACAIAASRGTIVESQADDLNSSQDIFDPSLVMNIFPNPTDDQINLAITSEEDQNVALSIVTMDGREVLTRNVRTSILTQTFSIDVSDLPGGFYFVKASTNKGISIEKIVIN